MGSISGNYWHRGWHVCSRCGREGPQIPANDSNFEITLKSKTYTMLHNISHQRHLPPMRTSQKACWKSYIGFTGPIRGRNFWIAVADISMSWSGSSSKLRLLFSKPCSTPPPTLTNCQALSALILGLHSLWFSSKNVWTGSFSGLSCWHLTTIQKTSGLKGGTKHKEWAKVDHWQTQALLISHCLACPSGLITGDTILLSYQSNGTYILPQPSQGHTSKRKWPTGPCSGHHSICISCLLFYSISWSGYSIAAHGNWTQLLQAWQVPRAWARPANGPVKSRRVGELRTPPSRKGRYSGPPRSMTSGLPCWDFRNISGDLQSEGSYSSLSEVLLLLLWNPHFPHSLVPSQRQPQKSVATLIGRAGYVANDGELWTCTQRSRLQPHC